MIYWFTGQPGSGKTTLAYALKNKLGGIHLDSDDIRKSLGNWDYSEIGRRKFIPKIQILAEWLHSFQINIFVSMVAPYRDLREDLKSRDEVCEIYLHTDEVRGKERLFLEDYEPPLENFLDIDTSSSVEDCINKILALTNEGSAVCWVPMPPEKGVCDICEKDCHFKDMDLSEERK